MAIIKFGTMVVGARGTIGGLIYTAGKAGPYVRPWAPTSNPRTAFQETSRSILSEVAREWSNASSAQQNDWDTYAAASAQELTNPLGETYFVSGFNWFCNCNSYRLARGAAVDHDAPPSAPATTPVITNFAIASDGECTFDINSAAWDNFDQPWYYLAYARSEGATYIRNNRRFVKRFGSPSVDATTIDAADVTAKFGSIIPGTRWELTCLVVRTNGRYGESTTAQANIT